MKKKSTMVPDFKQGAETSKHTPGKNEGKSIISSEEAARITASIRAERKRNGENAPF